MFKLYQIICPVRYIPVYIGMCGCSLQERLKGHFSDTENIEKFIFLNQMKSFGLTVVIEELFVSDDPWEIRRLEKNLITEHVDNGLILLNRAFVPKKRRFARKPKQAKKTK